MATQENALLIQKFLGNVYERPYRYGLTGALDSSGAVISDPTIDRNGNSAGVNRIFARINGQETAVFNMEVATIASGLPIEVARHTTRKRDEIVGADGVRADFAFGTDLPAMVTPTPRPGLDRSVVDSRRLGPGHIFEDKDELLTIRAMSFEYVNTAGVEKAWASSAGVPLTGDVPGSANEHVLVRIAFDPDATTPTLVATAGTAKSTTRAFDVPAEALDIAIDPGYISLGVVRLENGDDSRTARLPDDGGTKGRFTDLRVFIARSVARAPRTYIEVTANYTALATDETINVDASSGNVTIAIPTAVGVQGKRYDIRKSDVSGNTVTLDPNGSQTINADLTKIITEQYTSLTIESDNANWMVM